MFIDVSFTKFPLVEVVGCMFAATETNMRLVCLVMLVRIYFSSCQTWF